MGALIIVAVKQSQQLGSEDVAEDLGDDEERGEGIERERDEELQELAPDEPRPSWISFRTFDLKQV